MYISKSVREIFGTDLRNTVLRAALLLIMHSGQFI